MNYIFSDKYKFVYLVTQKVACSSIKDALLPLFPIDGSKYQFVDERGIRRARIHRAFRESEFQINEIRLMQKLANHELAGYFWFGFVRNPWDRLVSCFDQKIARAKPDLTSGDPLNQPKSDPALFRLGMSFEEFTEAVCSVPDDEADPHFRSQSDAFYINDDRPCIANFVGRFESLNADFEKAMQEIGIQNRVHLPHLLRSDTRKSNYRNYYTRRTKQLVADRFSADIENFGYDF